MEGSKVVRLWLGGGWPEVSRWSRGRCRGSNKLPPRSTLRPLHPFTGTEGSLAIW